MGKLAHTIELIITETKLDIKHKRNVNKLDQMEIYRVFELKREIENAKKEEDKKGSRIVT